MGDARLGGEGAHGIDLVLHQGDQGRDDDGHPFHKHRRELVAERLSAARRHQDEGVAPGKDVSDHRLLVSLERREAEIFLQFVVQQISLFLFHNPASELYVAFGTNLL